ncbi:MAG: hypothetical protein K8F27_13445, partial [Sulfuricellaceae bacterium]|nr:hypothetical protein [Sulfuricellaceae bacterium]
RGKLHPGVILSGRFERSEIQADVDGVMREIDAARDEEEARRKYRQELEQRNKAPTQEYPESL